MGSRRTRGDIANLKYEIEKRKKKGAKFSPKKINQELNFCYDYFQKKWVCKGLKNE